jgi:quinol monooxygenase YgiN
MADKTVRVVTRVRALPDKADKLKQILLGLVDVTRKETGCISYHLLQNAANVSDFVFVEEWKSSTDFDAHLATSHVKEAIAKATPVIAGSPEIASYSVLK